MAGKKKNKKVKNPTVSAIHGLMRKAGPMKHRLNKRKKQRERNFDLDI